MCHTDFEVIPSPNWRVWGILASQEGFRDALSRLWKYQNCSKAKASRVLWQNQKTAASRNQVKSWRLLKMDPLMERRTYMKSDGSWWVCEID